MKRPMTYAEARAMPDYVLLLAVADMAAQQYDGKLTRSKAIELAPLIYEVRKRRMVKQRKSTIKG